MGERGGSVGVRVLGAGKKGNGDGGECGKRSREIVMRGEDERHLPRRGGGGREGGTSGVRQTSATEWCSASRVTANKPQGIQMVSRQSFDLPG